MKLNSDEWVWVSDLEWFRGPDIGLGKIPEDLHYDPVTQCRYVRRGSPDYIRLLVEGRAFYDIKIPKLKSKIGKIAD